MIQADLTMSSTALHLLICLVGWLSTQTSAQNMGAFDFIWSEVGEVEDVGTGELLFIKPRIVKKGRSETALILNLTITRDVDVSVGVRITLAIFGNGGWRPNFFSHSFSSFCGYLDEYVPNLGKELYRQCGVEECPFLEGEYAIDISLSNIQHKFHSFPFGKYKGDMEFFRVSPSGEDYVIGAYAVVVEMKPKNKKKG